MSTECCFLLTEINFAEFSSNSYTDGRGGASRSPTIVCEFLFFGFKIDFHGFLVHMQKIHKFIACHENVGKKVYPYERKGALCFARGVKVIGGGDG